MKRSSFAFALSLFMTLGAFAPALAADSADGLDMALEGALLPVRVVGVGAALLLGTPIAIVRETTKSYIHLTSGAADKVGGHTLGPACVVANVFSAPAALVVGSAKGVYSGTKNGFVHGFDKPFNPESFSLGSLEE